MRRSRCISRRQGASTASTGSYPAATVGPIFPRLPAKALARLFPIRPIRETGRRPGIARESDFFNNPTKRNDFWPSLLLNIPVAAV